MLWHITLEKTLIKQGIICTVTINHKENLIHYNRKAVLVLQLCAFMNANQTPRRLGHCNLNSDRASSNNPHVKLHLHIKLILYIMPSVLLIVSVYHVRLRRARNSCPSLTYEIFNLRCESCFVISMQSSTLFKLLIAACCGCFITNVIFSVSKSLMSVKLLDISYNEIGSFHTQ